MSPASISSLTRTAMFSAGNSAPELSRVTWSWSSRKKSTRPEVGRRARSRMRNSNRRFVAAGTVLLTAVVLALALAGPAQVLAQVSTPTAGEDSVYRDPEGRFAIPIPTNWIAEEHDGYVSVAT